MKCWSCGNSVRPLVGLVSKWPQLWRSRHASDRNTCNHTLKNFIYLFIIKSYTKVHVKIKERKIITSIVIMTLSHWDAHPIDISRRVDMFIYFNQFGLEIWQQGYMKGFWGFNCSTGKRILNVLTFGNGLGYWRFLKTVVTYSDQV